MLTDNNKIQNYTKYILEGMIPMWVFENEEVDTLLDAYIQSIANWYLSNLERIDGYKMNNKVTYDFLSFIKNWGINNIIDFYDVKNVGFLKELLGEEEGVTEYKKYILKRFPEMMKWKGTSSILKALISKLGVTLKILLYVRGLPGTEYPEKEIAERDLILLGRAKELWYTNPEIASDPLKRIWEPTTKVDILFDLVSSPYKNKNYMYISPSLFLNVNKAVQNMLPFHVRYGGVFIKVSGIIQSLSPFSSYRQEDKSNEQLEEEGSNLNELKEEVIIENNSWSENVLVAEENGYGYLSFVNYRKENKYRPLIPGTYFSAFLNETIELSVRWILNYIDTSALIDYSLVKKTNGYILIGNKYSSSLNYFECRIWFDGKIEFWKWNNSERTEGEYVKNIPSSEEFNISSLTIRYTYKTNRLFRLKSQLHARDRLRIRTL